jgi:hypothetical protein
MSSSTNITYSGTVAAAGGGALLPDEIGMAAAAGEEKGEDNEEAEGDRCDGEDDECARAEAVARAAATCQL